MRVMVVIGLLAVSTALAAAQATSVRLPAETAGLDQVVRTLVAAFDDVRHEAEPGREQYFFAMLNDQRRHLAVHFEDSDPAVVPHLQFAAEQIQKIAAYCERSLEESVSFKFSC